ncbi:MAG: WD40/YVTN/BNR-like repeat-containing protein, partial [bacterium]
MIARLVLAAALGTLGAGTIDAQPRAAVRPAALSSVDTSVLRGLRYRMVGPPRGGRVTAVAGVPSQPQTFYRAAASGGVFKTTNGGQTWLPITDGQMPVASVGAITVADSDPNV